MDPQLFFKLLEISRLYHKKLIFPMTNDKFPIPAEVFRNLENTNDFN